MLLLGLRWLIWVQKSNCRPNIVIPMRCTELWKYKYELWNILFPNHIFVELPLFSSYCSTDGRNIGVLCFTRNYVKEKYCSVFRSLYSILLFCCTCFWFDIKLIVCFYRFSCCSQLWVPVQFLADSRSLDGVKKWVLKTRISPSWWWL